MRLTEWKRNLYVFLYDVWVLLDLYVPFLLNRLSIDGHVAAAADDDDDDVKICGSCKWVQSLFIY